MNQTMLAIFDANPDAFGGNINILRAGASLRIPSADDIYRIDRGFALDEARRQHVLQQLELMQFPLPSEQVVIGRAPTLGISGEESLKVYNNLTRMWELGGRGTTRGRQGSSAGFPGLGAGMGSGGALERK